MGPSGRSMSLGSMEVPAVFQRSWGDPHLVVVSVFYCHHGDGARGAARWSSAFASGPTVCVYRSIIAPRLCPLSGAILLSRYARPLYRGNFRASAFKCDIARTRLLRLRAGRGSVRGATSVCVQAKFWDPYSPLIWMVVVKPPDPHVDEVVWGTSSRGKQRLELPHTDIGSCMPEEGRCEQPVVEVRPEGAYQVVPERAVVAVVCSL